MSKDLPMSVCLVLWVEETCERLQGLSESRNGAEGVV